MNTITTSIFDTFTARGIQFRIEEGRLKVDAPKGALTSELKTELLTRKGEILTLLLQQLPKSSQEVTTLPVTSLTEEQTTSFVPLKFEGTSPPTDNQWTIPVARAHVAANVLEDFSSKFPSSVIATNASYQPQQPPISWHFTLTINHQGEHDEDRTGKLRGPFQLALSDVSSPEHILPKIEAALTDREQFSPMLAFTNPSWRWSLQIAELATQADALAEVQANAPADKEVD